jgi:uncharacterized membrane protein (UPF0182 family)
MYIALLIILLGLSLFLFITGAKKEKKIRKYSGAVLAVLTVAFFFFMDFWGEALWFENLGYGNRFWTIVNSNALLAAAGALIGFIIIYLLTIGIPKKHKFIKPFTRLLGVILGGFWGFTNWEIILKWWYGVSTGVKDPILGKDVGFYLFSLPFYDALFDLLFMLSVISLVASFITTYLRFAENKLVLYIPEAGEVTSQKYYFPFYFNSAMMILIIAAERFFSRYHLMYSSTGVAYGMSWTDVNILLPATYAVIIILILLAVCLLIPGLRARQQRFISKKMNIAPDRSHILVVAGSGITIAVIWILAFGILPYAFNWLVVKPNEITYERPYILNNIEFTRLGFGLNKMEEKEYPMDGTLNQETINASPDLFSNIRLWDWKALDAVYRQFQSMRLYYEFSDVDVDRYNIDGKDRQVMVSAREINIDNLPQQSQTFVNKRFQYTHGYGLTMAGVSEFNAEGLPHLLIKDIPPVSESGAIEVKQPQIYFGEMTKTPVIVNSKVKEFDYPSGEDNAYTNYTGKGGVELSSFWRKFLYGWKFDGTNFLFSDYPTNKSRFMFHRQILERVQLLAPFLDFDKDPYLVLANGKLCWMIDAYTTSNYFPYSQPFSTTEHIQYREGNTTQTLTNQISEHLEGINYIRNSVKAVVDAYDGSVNFYIMDPNDPIIKVWSAIFPDLFKSKAEMPKEIKAHIRYPKDMLLAQGIVYQKYHMTDPTVFYNQEDLWVRATDKYYNKVQPVEPYYIMWQQPGTKKQQFVLMLPFTPKNRQVLIGWIAGLCDADNYGHFVAYQFSKDKTILGPQQVESKIDQDSFLSGQLSLWDQRGSKVIRGNVLAIPVNNTLFYVEPIYLQAETAAYPELRMVVVMHGDNMSYAKTFDEALNGLFSKSPVLKNNSPTEKEKTVPITVSQLPGQIKAANDAFNSYLKLNAERKFSEAAKELEKLQQALQTLSNQSNEKKK